MKIFVTWSGERSRESADVLVKFLPFLVPGADVFMSKHNIESGERWNNRLANELNIHDFGLLCLTRENLSSPWVLFEAGALTKHAEGRACALLLCDLSPAEITGPLSQFQHRRFNKDDFWLLVRDLNRLAEHPYTDTQVEAAYLKWWPEINQEYSAIVEHETKGSSTIPKRSYDEMIEEILVKVRSLELSVGSHPRTNKHIVRQQVGELSEKIIIDVGPTRPLLRVPYDPDFKVRELLDLIFYKLGGAVKPFTFGHEWMLVDYNTGRRMTELEINREPGDRYFDNRVFSEVGLRPGLKLIVDFIKSAT